MYKSNEEHAHRCCCAADQAETENCCGEVDIDTQLLAAFELKADIEAVLDQSECDDEQKLIAIAQLAAEVISVRPDSRECAFQLMELIIDLIRMEEEDDDEEYESD
ncbi:hypothetical protein [Methanomethylovorans sp.]|jgi:hypothetical protein|uniref:hypothetical protein n=1 Tax=Methanomethylovorans sp. TaxID=2758717 RepID=UPI003D0D5D04